MVKKERIIAHDVECEEKIFDKYKEIFNRGVCTRCNARNNLDVLNNGFPVSLYVVGKKFREQNPRILFVGKTLRDGWDENDDGPTAYICDKNEKEIFIDVTKDNHEERSFKGVDHIDDIIRKGLNDYVATIERFETEPYPHEVISNICEMLNDSGYKNKKNGKQYDEKATTEFLRGFDVKDIKDILFTDTGKKSKGSNHPFAQCIKDILEVIHNTKDVDELWRRAAITNVVKCSVSKKSDKTPLDMARNCICNAGFITSEIETIQPTHIVFFTARDRYIRRLKKLRFENLQYEQINEKRIKIGVHNRKEIGKIEVTWWYRVFFDEQDNVKMHMLVTRHPAARVTTLEKDEWKNEIAEWIKYTHEKIHKKSDIETLKLKYE